LEWKSRNEITEEEIKSPTPKVAEVKWIPPDPMSLKCNTDGAWSKETGTGGIGWLLRDHQGLLVWAGAKKLAALRSAIETKAEAIRWALQTIMSFGYRSVIMETDSLLLAQMLNGEEEVWPLLQPIIQDISTMLSRSEGYEVRYYLRSSNKSADRIAKETTTFTFFVFKLYSIVHEWLSSCVMADKLFVRQ